MPLSTTQYGYIIDPLVPLTDDTGRTISNGYVRVFMAGTSTPVITYKNFDGATNEETVQLDNSGRTAYPVIGSKGSTYKVCVYDAEHSQETPIKTIDKVVPTGASVSATNVVTGLDNVESPEAGWVKSTVSGTDAEVSLDATNVTSEVDTMVKATAASADYMMPLVHKTGSDPDKKITLGNIFKFVLNFIHSLTDTATESDIASGNYFALDGSAGTKKLNSTTLLTKTAQNALAGNVAPAFVPNETNAITGMPYVYGGQLYFAKEDYSGAWDASKFDSVDTSAMWRFVTNSEYIFAVVDNSDRLLFGIRYDGTLNWQKGLPRFLQVWLENLSLKIDNEAARAEGAESQKVDKVEGKSLIDSVFAGGVSVITNDEYVYAVVDSEDRILFAIRTDGTVYWQDSSASTFVRAEKGKTIVDKNFANAQYSTDGEEYHQVVTDRDGRLLEAISTLVKKIFFIPAEFRGGVNWSFENLFELSEGMKKYGLFGNSGQGDWSDKDSLQIGLPEFAIVNLTNINSFPAAKDANLHAYLEFWDMHGNYFKKKAILNAQGQSSMLYPKKNATVDLCNDEWVGDDTFKLKIGDWVIQDSFHLKAYYTDYFRGICPCLYKLYKQIIDTRPINSNRTWKNALLKESQFEWAGIGYGSETELKNRFDDGALCFPMGFPCAVYVNGEFYGIYSWQLKKHRDNYMMKKDVATHIHLDGSLLNASFFEGNIDWTVFEIRNPKNLYYKEAHTIDGAATYKYDGDHPYEIVDSETAEEWIASGQLPDGTTVTNKIAGYLRLTASVKQSIVNLTSRWSEISAMFGTATTEEIKEVIETYFDPENLIDYQLFSDVIQNVDGYAKNWQWTTWDGVKWFVNPYDLDVVFGARAHGDCIVNPLTTKLGTSHVPTFYVHNFYSARMEERYAELRNAGILSAKNIMSIVNGWMQSIGDDFYKLEYDNSKGVWKNSPCNKDIVVNADWDIVLSAGKPVTTNDYSNFFDSSRTYNQGDSCCYNVPAVGSHAGWYYTFIANKTTTSAPIDFFGIRDSIWRLESYVERKIEITDGLYNYTNN